METDQNGVLVQSLRRVQRSHEGCGLFGKSVLPAIEACEQEFQGTLKFLFFFIVEDCLFKTD
jgi:hypothetical protein